VTPARAADEAAASGGLATDARPLDWNGPVARPFNPFAADDLDVPIVELVARVVHRSPDRTAVSDGTGSLTYAALWSRALALAETIELRTRPGDLVALLLPAEVVFPVALLACLAAGRPFLALDPNNPADWLAQVIAEAGPKLILGAAPATEGAPVLAVVDFPKGEDDGAGPLRPPARLDADAAACVLFTSGSTGRPKGVVNSQRNLLQRVAQSINAAHIDADDRLLTLASPCTIVGVRDLLTGLVAGACARLIDPTRAGAREVLQVARDERVSILFSFPALLRSIVTAEAEPAGAGLRMVRIGGDTTLWSDIESLRRWLQPQAAIQIVYAATEAPMMQWFVDDALRGEDPRVPIGYPLPGNKLAIVDDDGVAVVAGEIGELVVESPYVALGT